jgi:Trk K+ transport system NAD-binding subunit
MEEIEVGEGSDAAGATIDDVRGGTTVVAARAADGELRPTPSGATRLESGDVVVAMGAAEEMDALEQRFSPAAREQSVEA